MGNHSSRRAVTGALKQPTRKRREPRPCFPIWPCFGWGLPCRPCYHVRGELLPRRFTLACTEMATAHGDARSAIGGLLSVALSVALGLSTCCARPLAGIPLCEARTFLSAPQRAAVAWPTSRQNYTVARHRQAFCFAGRRHRTPCKQGVSRRLPETRVDKGLSSTLPGEALFTSAGGSLFGDATALL